jgi:hypothetical protein
MAKDRVVDSNILREKIDIGKLKKLIDSDRGSTLEVEIPRKTKNTIEKNGEDAAVNSGSKKLRVGDSVLYSSGKINSPEDKKYVGIVHSSMNKSMGEM